MAQPQVRFRKAEAGLAQAPLLELSGALTGAEWPAILELLEGELVGAHVVVDASGVSEAADPGLASLVKIAPELNKGGGSCVFVGVPAAVQAQLEALGLLCALDMQPSLDLASSVVSARRGYATKYQVDVSCELDWGDFEDTSEPEVRHCRTCERRVYKVTELSEFERRVEARECVAVASEELNARVRSLAARTRQGGQRLPCAVTHSDLLWEERPFVGRVSL